MFVEHAFTKCAEFLPLKSSILKIQIHDHPQRANRKIAHNELFVANGSREAVTEEGHTEIVCIISLVCDDVFEECCLMPQNLG